MLGKKVFSWYPVLILYFLFQLFQLLAMLCDSFHFPYTYFGVLILKLYV